MEGDSQIPEVLQVHINFLPPNVKEIWESEPNEIKKKAKQTSVTEKVASAGTEVRMAAGLGTTGWQGITREFVFLRSCTNR